MLTLIANVSKSVAYANFSAPNKLNETILLYVASMLECIFSTESSLYFQTFSFMYVCPDNYGNAVYVYKGSSPNAVLEMIFWLFTLKTIKRLDIFY